MTTRFSNWTRSTSLMCLAFVLTVSNSVHQFCGLDSNGAFAQNKQVKSISDVKSMLSPSLPADAKEISEAITSSKVGEQITIRGYIPDAKDTFASALAEFKIIERLPSAGQTPPIADPASTVPLANIRVLNAKGEPVSGTLKGQHGLKPGAEIFITGTVESADGEEQLVVNATSIHIPRAALPSGFFTAIASDKAKDISEARKSGGLKVGDEVVMKGRVGGSQDPFVSGRAVFTLVGRGLKACNENPDDHCSKPWDYCCDTRDEIVANSITVQVIDAKSQVLRTDMKGRRGLKELSEVIVIGKVAVADGKAVVVNATSMHVVK